MSTPEQKRLTEKSWSSFAEVKTEHAECSRHEKRDFLQQLKFDLEQDLSCFLEMVEPKEPGVDIRKKLSVIINDHINVVESKIKRQEEELEDFREKQEELEVYQGMEDLLSLPELAASSMMLAMEKELSQLLWEEMKKAADESITLGRHTSRREFFQKFNAVGCKVHMLEVGKFKYQYLDLMMYAKKSRLVPKEIRNVLKKTHEKFLRKRYRDADFLSLAEFQLAFEDFDILKDDRNLQEHIFDEGVGKADMQKRVLKLLRLNIHKFPRLQKMSPLLKLEILQWRKKLDLKVL